MISEIIGRNIKDVRIKKNLTQKELGKIIGRSGVAIMRYEKDSSDKDHREPSLEIIELIADALDVSPFELMGAEYPEIIKKVEYIKVNIEEVSTDELLEEIKRRCIK